MMDKLSPQPASIEPDLKMPLPGQDAPLSVAQYIGLFLLLCIPISNLILLFVWSFGARINQNKKNFARASLILMVCAAIFMVLLTIFFGKLFLPTPTNEQILQAVILSNAKEAEPLDFVYEEMQVPHRYPGRASAVLLVPDQSIQRNFDIVFDKKTKSFYVADYITLVTDEDGVFRKEQE